MECGLEGSRVRMHTPGVLKEGIEGRDAPDEVADVAGEEREFGEGG